MLILFSFIIIITIISLVLFHIFAIKKLVNLFTLKDPSHFKFFRNSAHASKKCKKVCFFEIIVLLLNGQVVVRQIKVFIIAS